MTTGHHIFLNLLSETHIDPDYVEGVIKALHRRYGTRLWGAGVRAVELKINVRFGPGAPLMPIRLVATNPTGYVLHVDSYVEILDPTSGLAVFSSISTARSSHASHTQI